jgi:hypothetical protein
MADLAPRDELHVIPILGRAYRVEYLNLNDEFGACLKDKGIIQVHKKLNDRDRQETIVHEVLHGILHESGLEHLLTDELEEAIVRAFDHGLNRSGLIRPMTKEELYDDDPQAL